MPSVISLMAAPGIVLSVKRTLYPTISPTSLSSSAAMRLAMELAAMRRGCVCPIKPLVPRPAKRQILGNCVVLPEPVSPQTTMTGFSRMALTSSSPCSLTGRPGASVTGFVIGLGGTKGERRVWATGINSRREDSFAESGCTVLSTRLSAFIRIGCALD